MGDVKYLSTDGDDLINFLTSMITLLLFPRFIEEKYALVFFWKTIFVYQKLLIFRVLLVSSFFSINLFNISFIENNLYSVFTSKNYFFQFSIFGSYI